MGPHGFLRVLQARWLTVLLVTAAVVLGALVIAWRTPPQYEASTTLFVSSRGGTTANMSDLYEGGLFSQARVQSYAELIKDDTLALRTIGKLGLPMTVDDWKEQVTAGAKAGTVLIDVRVRNASPTRARDIANTLSDEFVTLAEELETARPGDAAVARVIVAKRATVPTRPVVRQPLRNTAIGLALGLMLGSAVALVRDRLDSTIQNGEDLEEVTGAGLVASIPFDQKLSTNPCISFSNEKSPSAEAFRTLRANLQFLDVDAPPRVLVVTCCEAGDGKSITALNLALALANSGKKVALVDADLRRPSLHTLLGLDDSPGFSNVLSGQDTLENALQQTHYTGLYVLTSGTLPPDPGEILASSASRNLLNELRSRFDYVIMDSSPLLAVADAAILAAESDGALMVCRFGTTRPDHLRQAVRRVEKLGARVLGGVLTMIPVDRDASNRGYLRYAGKIAPKSK